MIRNRSSSIMGSAALFVLLVSTPALAQDNGARPIGFGPIAGYDLDFSKLFLGGAFRIGLPLLIAENPVLLDADFEYYLDTPGVTVFSIQAAGLVPLVLQGSPVRPVVGAGLNYFRSSVSTALGSFSSSNIQLALVGGIMVRAFFADLNLRVGDGSTAVVRVGFLALGNMM